MGLEGVMRIVRPLRRSREMRAPGSPAQGADGNAFASRLPVACFLVLDDEANTISALRELLESDGHDVAAFSSAGDAVAALKQSRFDAVLTALELPGPRDHSVVRLTREYHPTACVFVTTVREAPPGLGEACHVFEKPLDYRDVTQAVAACRAEGGPGRHGRCCMKVGAPLPKS